MSHIHRILSATILGIAVLNSTEVRDEPCRCHSLVGSVDVVYSKSPLTGDGQGSTWRTKLYFDFFSYTAISYEHGRQGNEWVFYEHYDFYERKTNGTCIKHSTNEFPLNACVPEGSKYMGTSTENGRLVDGWKYKTGQNTYKLYVLDRENCAFKRIVNFPQGSNEPDMTYYNYTKELSDYKIFDKNLDDCVLPKPATPNKDKKLIGLLKGLLSQLKMVSSKLTQ